MIESGQLEATQWEAVVSEVSNRLYDGNVVPIVSSEHIGPRSKSVRSVLRVEDSRGEGARRSWSGRRTVSACWHAHRDVYRELFHRFPAATITTAMAHYTAQNFEDTYPETGWRNVGSIMSPVTMPELCEH